MPGERTHSSSTDARSVAVCICTRDRPKELAETLGSIARSSKPVHRVIVSDDGQDRRTQEICAEAPIEVRHVAGPRRGLGANRNHALTHVAEDVVLFLDDDCLLGAGFLDSALMCMDEAEQSFGFGRVIVTGGEMNRGSVVRASGQTFLGFQARPYARGEAMTSIVINATVFPRSLFENHRFDDQLTYGYDEVDLASRAVKHGYRIVSCTDAINDHRPSPRSRGDYGTAVDASRLFVTLKRYAMTDRHYGRAAAFALVAPAHTIAAASRAHGLRGALSALVSIRQAGGYFMAHARASRARRAGVPWA
jgi:GT2 family glycosyltransferase